MIIVYIFFATLAGLIAGTALRKKRNERIVFAVSAFMWSCLMLELAGWAESLNYNIWYSSATDDLLTASIQALEENKEGELLREMKALQESLVVTYEMRGDYPDQVLKTVEKLTPKAESGSEEH
jgi:hypothetical protein